MNTAQRKRSRAVGTLIPPQLPAAPVEERVGRAIQTVATAVAFVSIAIASPVAAQAMPDSTDTSLLLVANAVLVTSAHVTTPWPGYDASSRPLAVYRVGRWSVLLNPPSLHPVDGWLEYPDSWPRLSRPAWFKPDGDRGLVGQLAFDYEVPGGQVVAVPLYEQLPSEYGQRDLYLYSFIVHEAFHQFQRHHFSDVETPSEEFYPMLDSVNNALAGLELRALKEALEALFEADSTRARESAVLALAVHDHRLEELDNAARTIERSKEVVEGTAKYVETQMVAALAHACRTPPPALVRFCPTVADIDAARWLADDFDRRISAGAIAPMDMARNRIYPMAAAAGFLLDVHDPDWKTAVERDGTGRGLFQHLADAIGPTAASRSLYVDRARERYGWQSLLSASAGLVGEYLDGYNVALRRFNAEAGTRVVLRVPVANITRSRSSREDRWVVDAGRRTLGSFVVFTLSTRSGPGFDLNVRNAYVLDETDDDGYRSVTLHVIGPVSITADAQPVSTETEATREFESLSFEASGAGLHSALPGMLTTRPGELRIRIREPGGG
jgi:hypothetical protein